MDSTLPQRLELAQSVADSVSELAVVFKAAGDHTGAKALRAAASSIVRAARKHDEALTPAAPVATATNCVLSISLPIRTFSEANRRGHWGKGYSQTGDQRPTVAMVMRAHANARGLKVKLPCAVKLVRCAPQMLDPGDNLEMSLKHVRDGVADWIGVNDRDDTRVRYEYAQEPTKHYGVRIEVLQ